MNIKKLKKQLKTNKRFTLIELIIVIVVIGILAAMALPKFVGVVKNAKVGTMEVDLDVIEKAVLLYNMDSEDDSYPFLNKVSISDGTLKDSLIGIGDDCSEVYKLDMDALKPYIDKLKYPEDTYLYSPQSGVAANEEGKIDGDDKTHHILNGGITSNTTSTPNAPDFVDISNSYNMYSTNIDLIALEDGRTVTLLNDKVVVRDITGKVIQTIEYNFDKGDYEILAQLIDKGNNEILVVSQEYYNKDNYYNILVNLKDGSCTEVAEGIIKYIEKDVPNIVKTTIKNLYETRPVIEIYKDKYISYGLIYNEKTYEYEYIFTVMSSKGEIESIKELDVINSTTKTDDPYSLDTSMTPFLKVYDNGDLYYSTTNTFAKITLK